MNWLKRNIILNSHICSLFFALITISVSAQTISEKNGLTISNFESNNFILRYHPVLNAGTHINQLVYSISPAWNFNVLEESLLQLLFQSDLRLNEKYLGIEGASIGAVNKAGVTFFLGTRYDAFLKDSRFKHHRKHNIGYYFVHYASTDETNQFSGGLCYDLLFPKSILSFRFEDDFFALLGYDEFRTGAASLDYRFIKHNKLWGIGIGATLWTGSTKGLKNLDYRQEYNMTHQYGANYSHGILCLNLHYQFLTLSVGYDSENIRTSIQDTVHKWIDDGTIPKGRLSEDRFFFQLKLFAFDGLY